MNVYTYDYLERNGRLGNQLWQISSCLAKGIARENDLGRWRVSLRPDWEYRKFFSVPDQHFEPLQPHERQLDGGTGYFQELRYVMPVEHTVREIFAPSELAKNYIIDNYKWFFNAGSGGHKTAVHVRRGDYLNHPKHFPLPPVSYYLKAVSEIEERVGGTTVLVFSDDIEWCKSKFPSDWWFMDGVARPVELEDRYQSDPQDQWDLFLQTMCDEHVISNSTFSWWGAFLSNNRRPYYPSIWFGPATGWQKCPAPEGWRAC